MTCAQEYDHFISEISIKKFFILAVGHMKEKLVILKNLGTPSTHVQKLLMVFIHQFLLVHIFF